MFARALVAHKYSSGEIFNNDFAQKSRYFFDTMFNICFQCLGSQGFVGVNLKLQKSPQKKVIGVKPEDRSD